MDTDRILALADRIDLAPHLTQYDVIEEALAALRALVGERQAVLDLHHPLDPGGRCGECADWPPCPTVRALGVTE